MVSLDDSNMGLEAQSPTGSRQPVGCLHYFIGCASFIPLVGVLFGIVSIILGFAKRTWQLIALGACGILFTIVLYGALFYFGFFYRGGIFDELRSNMSVGMLNTCVKDIEFYKLTHGHYPSSLRELDPKDKMEFPTCVDPTIVSLNPQRDRYFFYQLDPSGSFYFLFSVGPDGKPFTADDIFPTIPAYERAKTGLRLEKESSNSR